MSISNVWEKIVSQIYLQVTERDCTHLPKGNKFYHKASHRQFLSKYCHLTKSKAVIGLFELTYGMFCETGPGYFSMT